jgi:hypothetical protein
VLPTVRHLNRKEVSHTHAHLEFLQTLIGNTQHVQPDKLRNFYTGDARLRPTETMQMKRTHPPERDPSDCLHACMPRWSNPVWGAVKIDAARLRTIPTVPDAAVTS